MLCAGMTAAQAAASGDTIVFAASPFSAAQTITLSDAAGFQELVINKNLTITGRGARLLTVRRDAAASDFRIFTIGDNTTVTISGLTVTGERAVQGGGSLKGAGGSLTLDSVTVSGSAATGLTGGGGLYTFANATISNSTFSGNSADSNTTTGGGGIRVAGGARVSIVNSTVSGNSVMSFGGGIFVASTGELIINNSTVAFNSAGNTGGIVNNGGIAIVQSTIVASNSAATAPDAAGSFTTGGSNLIGNSSGSTGFGGSGSGDKLNVAANLAALADNGGQTDTHALLVNSPAIDAGSGGCVTSTCASVNPPISLTTDQRGTYSCRFDNPSVTNTGGSDGTDIGAFELQVAPTAAAVSISSQVLTSEGRGLTNARVMLTDQNGMTRTAITSSFGYFRFADVSAGETVIVSVVSKRYWFAPQVVSVTEDLTGINFIGQPSLPGIFQGGKN